MSIASIFSPDHVRYEGVRPINIYLLRLIYLLMAAFVAPGAWSALISHEGPWQPTSAVAFCVWAAYPTLAVLGLLHPLRMLPIMLFMILYKALWLGFVAYPEWRADALAGSPAEELTYAFLWLPLPIIAVLWRYVFETHVRSPKRKPAVVGTDADPVFS